MKLTLANALPGVAETPVGSARHSGRRDRVRRRRSRSGSHAVGDLDGEGVAVAVGEPGHVDRAGRAGGRLAAVAAVGGVGRRHGVAGDGRPPLEAGAVKLTLAEPFAGAADTPVGAPGMVASGVTGLTPSTPVPMDVVALTVKV